MDTPEVVKFDEIQVIGSTRILIVAPEPAPTEEEMAEILDQYRRAALEIRQEQINGKELKEGAK